MEYERVYKCRNYFIFDEQDIMADKLNILAYFSLSMKVLKVPLEYSNRKIKKLDGMFSKEDNHPITEFAAFLIGQLAKNDTYSDKIKGSEVLEFVIPLIYSINQKIGGRIVLVECSNIDKVLAFYKNNGFEIIRQDKKDKLIQLIFSLDRAPNYFN